MANRIENPRHLRKEPENLGFLYFDPERLLAINPAGQIVNPRSIRQMEGRFDPDLFSTPVVVRVATPEGELYLVTDGLNRLHYAAQHKDDTFPNKPDFSLNPIKVFNATESYLHNPTVVVPGEHPPALKALTLREYFRAVLPTTAVHTEIAPQRVAAHLIRAWENMVGEEVAQKFSLIAALQHRASFDSGPFVANQTSQEEKLISRALDEIHTLIGENHLDHWEIKKHAFMLVVNRSQIIGGDIRALREVQGMLYHPEIDRKLQERVPNEGEREIIRGRIGQFVADVLKAGPKNDTASTRYVDFVKGVLTDKRLTLDEVADILSDIDPQKAHEKVFREKNHTLLLAYYQKNSNTKDLSPYETYFIERFGRVPRIEHNLSILSSTIKLADSVSREAKAFYDELHETAGTLVESGIPAESLKSYIETIGKIYEDLQNRRNPRTLNEEIAGLRDSLNQIRRQIKQQQCVHWAGNFIVKEGGTFDPGVAFFLVRQLDLINQPLGKKEPEARQLLQQLRSLDEDIRQDVVLGSTRIEVGLRQQNQRSLQSVQSPRSVLPTRVAQSPETDAAATRQEPPVFLAARPVVTTDAKKEQDITLIDKDRAERRRKEANNQRIAQVLSDTREAISNIDLDPTDYDPKTKQIMDNLIRYLGKLSVGHPDILRTHEEWKRHNEERTKAQINKIEDTLEEAQRDTRTKK